MYSDPVFDYMPLIECYTTEKEVYPWSEHTRQEMTQNIGALWLHETLKKHPLRTMVADEADLFVIPFDTFLSAILMEKCEAAKSTSGEWHNQRVAAVKRVLEESPYLKRNRGHDHLLISPWFGTPRVLGGGKLPNTSVWWAQTNAEPNTLWSMLRSNAILATIDEFFARDWNKVLVVPYVAHADITNLSHSLDPEAPDHPLLSDEDTEKRNSTFFFRGGISHGVNCRSQLLRGNSWLRKFVFEVFEDIPHAEVVPTEVNKDHLMERLRAGQKDAVINEDEAYHDRIAEVLSQVTETSRRKIRNPAFKKERYIMDLKRSKYCLHLRGDTTTSRRLFDSIAAGCVPFIISDDVHLPFIDQIDYSKFSVIVPERKFIRNAQNIIKMYSNNMELWQQKREALAQARRDLIYGYHAPMDYFHGEYVGPVHRSTFRSRAADHILQQAFELTAVRGRYRRFKETFIGKCPKPLFLF